jgi:hypothetical protein
MLFHQFFHKKMYRKIPIVTLQNFHKKVHKSNRQKAPLVTLQNFVKIEKRV